MHVAVGAGADDYTDTGDEWLLTTPADVMNAVGDALEAAKIVVKNRKLAFIPKNRKPMAGRDAEVALNLAEALDDHDDVQTVYADFDVSDEEMARIAAASS
jgi:transcriptional/translational regulatory protein YebC/TACO1